MDFRMEIASLELEKETPESKTRPSKKKKKYIPVAPGTNKRGKYVRNEELRQRQSENMKRRWAGPEGNKLRESVRNKSPEHRRKISETMKRLFEENPEYKQARVEQLLSIKRRHWTEEERRQISERQIGMFWVNNGERETRLHAGDSIPDDYVLGRLPFSAEHKRKTSESSQMYWDKVHELLSKEIEK